jgi:uncharacterized protein YbaR (Trm112 family)
MPPARRSSKSGRAVVTGREEECGGRAIDPKLLEILVCPVTKTTLEYDRDGQELISRAARLAFPIRDGIPILLEEEARRLED